MANEFKVKNGLLVDAGGAQITGSLNAPNITGSLLGTSSFATTSSFTVTSSFTQTASFVDFSNVGGKPTLVSGSSQIQLNGISGTTFSASNFTFPNDLIIQGNLTAQQFIISSSVAYITTSFSSGSTVFGNSLDDTHRFTGSLFVSNSLQITGSLSVTGNVNLSSISGSLFGTASWAQNSSTASYIINAVSSSFSTTSSFSVTSLSTSFADNAYTASFVQTAQTASYILTAISSSFSTNSLTASYILNAVSSSFSTNSATASYILNSISSSFSTNSATSSYVEYSNVANKPTLFSGSSQVQLNGITGTTFSASNFTFPQDVIIQGSLTAQQFIVSSSVAYITTSFSSGSTAFGNSLDDTHQFTGSLLVSNSVAVTGTLSVNNTITAGGITSSLFGTSSWSSNSVTASYVTGSIFIDGNRATSASFATTASFSEKSLSSSYSLTASYVNPLRQNLVLTGSLLTTQSSISAIDYIDFTIDSPVPSHLEGRIHWNVDRKTLQLDTDVNNFMIPVGHASVLRGRNINPYTLTKGMVVYINGNSGQFATFGTASWEDDVRSAYAIGIVAQDISTNNYGYAVVNGEITAINTNGFAPATLLYLSSSGKFTNIKPIAPYHTVRLGQVVVASTNGTIQVKVDNGYETDELHDVLLQNTASGDFLVKSGSIWINSKQLTGSYGLTGSLTATSFTGSLFGTSSLAKTALTASSADAFTVRNFVELLPGTDPGTSNISASYFFVSSSSDRTEQNLHYRNNGELWEQHWLEQITNTGLVWGGVVSITSSLTDIAPNKTGLLVSPGAGLLVNHNANTASHGDTVPTYVPFGPITASATFITSSQVTYLLIDENGQLVQQTTQFTQEQYLNKFPLGYIFCLTTSSISSYADARVTTYGQVEQGGEFIRAFGPLKLSGYDISSQSGSLKISIASGQAYRYGGFYSQNPDSPSVYDSNAVPTGSLVRVYRDPGVTGGFRAQTNAGIPYTDIDPTKWDNGSGTLQTVGTSEWTIQRIYQGVINSISYVYYGQNTYSSLALALQSITTDEFVESPTSILALPFIGYIVARGNTSNLGNTTDNRIIQAGLFRNTAGSSGGGGAAAQNLNDLADVDVPTATDGQALVYNSGLWVNGTPLNSTTASYASTALSASFSNSSISSSVSQTASYVNPLRQTVQLTGSLLVTGSIWLIESSSLTASQISNPFGDIIISAKSGSINTGSVEIHGGLKWKRTETATPTEIGDLITFGGTLGLIEGGTLTTSSAGPFVAQVGEAVMYTMTTFPYGTHNITKYSTIGSTNASRQITLPPTSSNYVYYNNSGVLTYAGTAPSSRSNIIVGRVTTDNSGIIYIDASQINAHHYGNYIDRFFREAFGPLFYTGAITTQGTTSGSLNVTSGTYYFSQNRITTDAGTPITFDEFYRSGSSYNRTTGNTIVNSGSYDDGSGVLALVPSGKYTKHSLYLLGDNSLQATANTSYMVVLGQSVYNTIGEAEAGSLPTPPSYFTDGVSIIASLVVTPNSSSIQTIIDERPRLGFVSPSKTGVITAHGDLTGLSNDDHTQYLLVDGDRQMSGDLGLGNNNLFNVNSITASSAGITLISASTAIVTYISGSLFGTSSWAKNSETASYVLVSNVIGYNGYQIATGSITASVGGSENDLFLIRSASVPYLVVSQSSNVDIYSNQLSVRNFTTKQTVLSVSESIVQIVTQSTIPTGVAPYGGIWFTSESMYIGIEG